jgi:hypothetical protein
MKRLLVAVLLAAGAVLCAAPARADSEPYYVTASTVQASGAFTISTITAAQHPLKFYSLQVKGVGAAASAWNVSIDGSLDGVNFYTILSHINTGAADGQVITSSASAAMPMLYIRAKLNSVTLGSATGLTVKMLATQ